MLDANEAVARVAYALNEVIAIDPITLASPTVGKDSDSIPNENEHSADH
jgi:pyruvate/2-oxoacid:ferredoxin oxidoreductase alpha subunit